MKLSDAIRQRHTYRQRMSSQPIPDDLIQQLMEAVKWAPSPFNVQPWELVLITDADIKDQLAKQTCARIVEQFKDPRFLDANGRWMRLTRQEWEAAGDGVLLEEHVNLPPIVKDPSRLRPLLENARHLSVLGYLGAGKLPGQEFAQWVREAPLIIVVFIDWDRLCPGEGARDWMLLGIGAMLQNLMLQATALGLVAQFISASVESKRDRAALRDLLSAPEPLEPIAMLRLGYPAEDLDGPPETPKRVRRNDFVHTQTWKRRSDATE